MHVNWYYTSLYITAYVCGPNSHYSPAMSPACQKTCMNPNMDDSLCSLNKMEGCVCDSGYVLSDKKCVPISECGCRDGLEYFPVSTHAHKFIFARLQLIV